MSKISIVEVGMRDGLQNEAVHLNQKQRFEFAKRLASTGLKNIEAGAFVSPRWVPQMAGSDQLLRQLIAAQKKGQFPSNVVFSALVPNQKGFVEAVEAGVKTVAIFGAASETFSKKNINCTIDESFARFSELMELAKISKLKMRGYVSTVFGCPYEGKIKPAKALKVIERFFDLGIYELSIGDTIGVATPKQVEEILGPLEKMKLIPKVAMHFHDTRGTALANIAKSLDYGVTVFDSSIGGLGGCPYAPGAAGNVATEDVVYLLEGMGHKTGLDLDKLINTTEWMSKQLGRKLVSRVSLAGRSCVY
jgi:hydroxymethylglutaryl-CoA lyase